jgi:hypothetical protein
LRRDADDEYIDVAIHSHPLLSLRVLWRKRALMRSLAGGESPERDAQLSFLAHKLECRRKRRRIASGIEHVVAAADDPGPHWTAAAPFDVPQVREARKELLDLAGRLRSRAPVNPRGVAQAELLLTDYASPLQGTIHALTVQEAASRAISALDEQQSPAA